MEKDMALESQKNAELAKELGLPALEGSEKQIAWAETIRMNYIKKDESRKDMLLNAQEALNKKGKEWMLKYMEACRNNGIHTGTMEHIVDILTINDAAYFIEERFDYKF